MDFPHEWTWAIYKSALGKLTEGNGGTKINFC